MTYDDVYRLTAEEVTLSESGLMNGMRISALSALEHGYVRFPGECRFLTIFESVVPFLCELYLYFPWFAATPFYHDLNRIDQWDEMDRYLFKIRPKEDGELFFRPGILEHFVDGIPDAELGLVGFRASGPNQARRKARMLQYSFHRFFDGHGQELRSKLEEIAAAAFFCLDGTAWECFLEDSELQQVVSDTAGRGLVSVPRKLSESEAIGLENDAAITRNRASFKSMF